MDSSQTVIPYSTRLPTELWGRCWKHTSSRDLRRLIFVSHYFRDICQPLLFQEQKFTAPDPGEIDQENWREITRRLHRSALRLKKLAASSRVVSVKSWNFQGEFDFEDLLDRYPNVVNIGMVEDTYLNVIDIFADTLGAYHNLRSLRLGSLTIDAPFRGTIASLVRLEDLHLVACDIICRTGPQLSLQRFTLGRKWGPENDDPLDIVAPQTLRALSIDDSRDSRALLSVIANESRPFNSLATLSVDVSDSAAKSFLAFLERCPQLTHLELEGTLIGPVVHDRPTPTMIPCLQSFTGPRCLAAGFITGRPVSAVRLSDGRGLYTRENKTTDTDIIHDLVDIAHASASIRSLSLVAPINVALKIFTTLANHFSELEELELGLTDPPPVRTAGPLILPSDFANDDSDSERGDAALKVDERTVEITDNESSDKESSDNENSVRTSGPLILSNDFANDVSDSESGDAKSELDERTVEISDNESLGSISSCLSVDIALVPDDEPEPVYPIPDVLLPGHMYTPSGDVFPPPPAPAASTALSPESFPSLLECICAGGATLPATLVSMRFTKPSPWGGLGRGPSLSLEEQHRAVLAFERQQPALRELEFDVDWMVWTRHGDLWTQKRYDRKIMSNIRRGD